MERAGDPEGGSRGKIAMSRLGDQTRGEIVRAAEATERDGHAVNRRALAREFGVSPQTVARVLDGPSARRGAGPHAEARSGRAHVVKGHDG
jgi:hypothetical protein